MNDFMEPNIDPPRGPFPPANPNLLIVNTARSRGCFKHKDYILEYRVLATEDVKTRT